MIELKNIYYGYDGEDILNDINLKVDKGETVLLCGTSGCGKSTITRLINGLIPNYFEGNLKGQVLINGKEIIDKPLYEISMSVGTVFQNPRSQFYNVDTRSELAFGLENRGIDENTINNSVDKAIEEYSIEKLMDRSIFDLSGGEKQKIACASVSITSPEILVLDEPSANLDRESIEKMKNIIKKWKSQHKTIIIAEHRLYYLWDLVDRVIYIDKGRIIRNMKPEEFTLLNEKKLHEMGLRSNCKKEIIKQNTTSKKLVIFKNLYFSYNNKKEFKVNEISILEGKTTAVIGENGLGKTTFLKCISGLNKRSKGEMIIHNKSYKNKERKKKIFMVMQDVNHQLFTESVLDEVLISMKEEDEKKALDILDNLDLLSYKDRHPISLSGGEKQRVAIATAIASEKDVLLFDEPTSGLDYKHMLQVANVFQKLNEMGKTVLVVTHDSELIEQCKANVLKLQNYYS